MNNFIGLQYKWQHKPSDNTGFTDCFQLVCEARSKLGLFNHSALFDWVYDQYTESTFSSQLLMRLLLQQGKRVDCPSIGDVALLQSERGALGTVTDHGILYIAPRRTVAHSPIHKSMALYFEMKA
jgi:hypothetical protein